MDCSLKYQPKYQAKDNLLIITKSVIDPCVILLSDYRITLHNNNGIIGRFLSCPY